MLVPGGEICNFSYALTRRQNELKIYMWPLLGVSNAWLFARPYLFTQTLHSHYGQVGGSNVTGVYTLVVFVLDFSLFRKLMQKLQGRDLQKTCA